VSCVYSYSSVYVYPVFILLLLLLLLFTKIYVHARSVSPGIVQQIRHRYRT
jgi:hypothetical protein